MPVALAIAYRDSPESSIAFRTASLSLIRRVFSMPPLLLMLVYLSSSDSRAIACDSVRYGRPVARLTHKFAAGMKRSFIGLCARLPRNVGVIFGRQSFLVPVAGFVHVGVAD